MKILNLILALVFTVSFIACGDSGKTDSTENKNNTNTDTKIENTSNTDGKDSDNKSSGNTDGIKLSSVGKIENASAEGNAPNFTWDENGSQMSISDLKGKVVFVNLWATWCGPCIKEMPELSEISEELDGDNFKMIGLNVFHQDGTPDVKDFLKEKPVSYWIVDGNDELVAAFEKATGSSVEGVPTTYIINKEGKIVETLVGSRDKATFMATINKYL